MDCETVFEGETDLFVPKAQVRSKRDPVFYNPHMELSRDVSVAVAKIIKPEIHCDALAGSGARGIRIAKEAGIQVVLNDLNPLACDLSRRNADLNGVDCEVSNDSANHFLSDKKYEFIDIDPFGPPVRYIDTALKALPKTGYLGVAATDTSVLCGRYPRACKRKYDAVSVRTDYYDELGLRILLGFIARNAVRYDFGVEFLFSHSTRHYMRAYARLSRGRSGVRKTQDSLGFIQHCFKCLDKVYRKIDELERVCSCGGELATAGPLWTGKFADVEFSKKLAGELSQGSYGTRLTASKLAETVAAEQAELKPYFDLHKLCRVAGKSAPKTVDLIGRLSENDLGFTNTHFNELGFRSDGKAADLVNLL